MSEFDRFIGLPYKDKGRDYDGIDCWGLVYLVYRDVLGIDVPSYTADYANAAQYEEVERLIAEHKLAWVPVAKPKKFDCALFRYGKFNSHVGIFVKRNMFIHVQEGGSCVVEDLKNPRWVNRLTGFYRHERLNESISA